MRKNTAALLRSVQFRSQAQRFAKWYRRERECALQLGRIAAGWLKHYSRTHNARILADGLHEVVGIRITGRALRNYRDIYRLHQSWLGSLKCGTHFHICHTGASHLRVVAAAKLPDEIKHRLLNHIESTRMTVRETIAAAKRKEIEVNRSRRRVKMMPNDPQVILGDCIDVVQRLKAHSVHHMLCDWQWHNTGIWRESYKAHPVYRPKDPVHHFCQFLKTVRPYLNSQCITWVFSKTTAFSGGQIGLPWEIQKTAHGLDLLYASEFVSPYRVAGYQSANTFLSIKHLPIHAFVATGFDFTPLCFSPSVGKPLTSPNHISQAQTGRHSHPYEKPVELFEELISMGTPSGLVFDAFAGSGAAGIAAIRCGCSYMGSEMQPYYVRMANRALARLSVTSRRSVSA